MKPALVHSYWGIGDMIYLNPAVKEVAQRHDHIYTCTPFPLLNSNIPNHRPISPLVFEEYRPQCLYISPMYFEHISALTHWFNDEWAAAKKRQFTAYQCYHGGEAFAPDHNTVDYALHVPNQPLVLEKPELFFPGPSQLALDVADYFLKLHNPTGKPVILFHPEPRGLYATRLPGRAAPDEVLRRVFDRLKQDFFLFDVTRCYPTTKHLFPLSELPVYYSTEWLGLEAIAAFSKLSAGVVCQGSCSLMVIAQAVGRPLFVMNGNCGSKIQNLNCPKLPAHQRQFTILEPVNYCGCWHDQTCTKIPDYSNTDQRVDEFLKTVDPK